MLFTNFTLLIFTSIYSLIFSIYVQSGNSESESFNWSCNSFLPLIHFIVLISLLFFLRTDRAALQTCEKLLVIIDSFDISSVDNDCTKGVFNTGVCPPESHSRENVLVLYLLDDSSLRLCTNSEDETL